MSVMRTCELMLKFFLLKVAPKEATAIFTKTDAFQNSPQRYQNIWSTFVSKNIDKNFQQSVNLATRHDL